MVHEEVLAFIKKGKSMNIPDDELKKDLQKGGWTEAEIQEGFLTFSGIKPPNLVPPVKSLAIASHGMWDAFEHILLFISLYVMSSAIAMMLHYFVDDWMPGAAVSNWMGYFSDVNTWALRGYISSLIVSLPLFIVFFLDITRRTIKDASMRNIRARKILTYITLIITFLIMLGHIISVTYLFLDGSVDMNIFFHLVVTLYVNGFVFVYYLLQVKQDRKLYA